MSKKFSLFIIDFSLTNPNVILRILIFFAYTLCLTGNLFRFFWVIVHHFKVFLKERKFNLEWYYYLDIIIFALSGLALYSWFMNLSKRD